MNFIIHLVHHHQDYLIKNDVRLFSIFRRNRLLIHDFVAPTAEELAMFQPIPLASFGPEGEIDSSEGEDDDDIEMPTGPPPGSDDSDDDEDDIEMPAGPPPVESRSFSIVFVKESTNLIFIRTKTINSNWTSSTINF